ncbi:MAG TPA: type I-F CRISPR-associated protein Csy2 [Aeromonadales bacterium]|nr:type I-F CRISPR-associated protein Csy2 [Aeromonadales bacterium]
MSHFILLNRIKVQNANAIAGFTWGFPAITHFLGFTHLLARKLADHKEFADIHLSGCAVIAHSHQVHTYSTYGEHEFTQSKNPAYQHKEDSKNKVNTPPVIEEGKINMTVSLLIGCKGYLGGTAEFRFIQWLQKNCLMQRLAGGTILDIKQIEYFSDDAINLSKIKRRLLPGFVLQERTQHLEKHYKTLKDENENAELLDAWLDFCCLKQQARPKSDLIIKYFQQRAKQQADDSEPDELMQKWEDHLKEPFQQARIPEQLKQHFAALENNKQTKKLFAQWQDYCSPAQETEADWEYVAKPESGYLVPIMIGYKAISKEFKHKEISNVRMSYTNGIPDDPQPDVCFVEAVHSIGEWQSIHRVKTNDELNACLWHYHYEKNWYLCTQNPPVSEPGEDSAPNISTQNPDDDF